MSILASFLSSKDFKKLINKGKEQDYLTPEEINDATPASIIETKDIDKILFKINDQKITIRVLEEDEETEAEVDEIDLTLSNST
jgi:RNA polymerase primary sigma factor